MSNRHSSRASESQNLTQLLRQPDSTDDKYTRGVLGVRTGAPQYPGAAVLGVTAAWRTGIGMVRYMPADAHDDSGSRHEVAGLTAPAAAVLAARPETVFGEGRADAWLVGSGTDSTGRSLAEREALERLLRGDAPVVVDAGALELAAEICAAGRACRDQGATTPMILTPHRGEFERIWGIARLGPLPEGWPQRRTHADTDRETAVLADAATRLANALGATVLLKGSTTIGAAPTGEPRRIGPATPWLATAGTGDVLAGILGALVASCAAEVRRDPELLRDLGAAAAALHDTAARIASGTAVADAADAASLALGRPSNVPGQPLNVPGQPITVPGRALNIPGQPLNIPGRPITALDVANAIPHAVAAALHP